MTIFFDFMIFSFFVFASNSLLSIANIRMERRVGSRSDFIKLFFNIIPTYMKNLVIIIILYSLIKTLYLDVINNKIFIFIPLLVFFISKTELLSQKYTDFVTRATCLSCLTICVLTARTFDASNLQILEHNPFYIIALITAFIAVYLFNKDKLEPTSVNIARNLALNMYVLYVFFPSIPFIYSTIISFGTLYVQFIIDKLTPRLNLFQTMRNSLILLTTDSLLGFIGNLVWTILILGVK